MTLGTKNWVTCSTLDSIAPRTNTARGVRLPNSLTATSLVCQDYHLLVQYHYPAAQVTRLHNQDRFYFRRTDLRIRQHLKARPVNSIIVENESASDFLDACQGWLSNDELINHGVLSLASILTPNHPFYRPPYLFIHVKIDNEIVGCCIYAEPDGLVLSTCNSEVPFVLYDYLQPKIPRPSRIFGPEEPALCLAKLFSDSTLSSYRIHSKWRIHRLNQFSHCDRLASGQIQLGQLDKNDLVREWGRSYNKERPANIDISQFLSKKLVDRNLYFWTDETPKCLATISGTNCSGPRISAVYTPPIFRTHGYATALISELSNMYLASGSAYVTLNTQAGDPVERIYKRLGYQEVGEKVSVIFEDQ